MQLNSKAPGFLCMHPNKLTPWLLKGLVYSFSHVVLGPRTSCTVYWSKLGASGKFCVFWMRLLHCAHPWVLCCNGRWCTSAVHLLYFLDHTRQHTCMVLQALTLTRRSLMIPCPADAINARMTHPSHILRCTGRKLPQSDRKILPRRSSCFLVLRDQPTHAIYAGGFFCSCEWCIFLPSAFTMPLLCHVRSRLGIAW